MILVSRIPYPKAACPRLQWSLAAGGNGTVLAGPSLDIDFTSPPFGVTLGLGRHQRKTPENVSTGCGIVQEKWQGQAAHII